MELQLQARHVLRADTRYIVSRRWKFDTTAATIAFPGDPSEFTSDSVWVEDTAYKARRQPGVAGPDGMYPAVHFRTAGQLTWNIGLRVWKCLQGNLENANTDKVLNPRQRNLETAHYKSRIEREILAWHVLNDPAQLTQGVALGAGTRFDDISSAASDPIAVLKNGAQIVKRKTGKKITDVLIPEPIFHKLCIHEKVMSYAVSLLNLSKDRLIDAAILEALIGEALVEKGAIKICDATFNNTVDNAYGSKQEVIAYFSGPTVVMLARATPGGDDGIDNGFGLGKFLSILKQAFPSDDTVQIATGNEGYGVYNFPNYELAGGGETIQLVDAWGAFVQNADAAYRISGAADISRSEYGSSLSFTP